MVYMLCKDCGKREIDTTRSTRNCSECLNLRLERQEQYYLKHKNKRLEYAHKYYQDNKEEIAEKMKDRYINPEKRAKILQKAKEYTNNNKEKVKAIKQRCVKLKPEQYAKMSLKNAHIRRTRIMGGYGSFTEEEWEAIKKKFNCRCLCCGKEKKLERDHVIPISKHGTNTIDNIQPLCKSCNASKGIKSTDYRWDVT